MPLEFSTTEREAASSGIKVLAYSESGVGKTVLCATAPRPVILSAEAGLLSLKKANLERLFGKDRKDITYDIPVIKIKTVQDLTDAFVFLTENPAMKDIDTICLDSISEIAETVLANSKKLNADPRKAYGDMAEKMIQVVKEFRDIPGKNVVIFAKMEKDKDEVSGMMLYGPMMPGKQTGRQLPYLFDEVFRLGVGKDQKQQEFRFLQTQPDLQYTAKDRSGALDPMEPAHLGHIFYKLKGS